MLSNSVFPLACLESTRGITSDEKGFPVVIQSSSSLAPPYCLTLTFIKNVRHRLVDQNLHTGKRNSDGKIWIHSMYRTCTVLTVRNNKAKLQYYESNSAEKQGLLVRVARLVIWRSQCQILAPYSTSPLFYNNNYYKQANSHQFRFLTSYFINNVLLLLTLHSCLNTYSIL